MTAKGRVPEHDQTIAATYGPCRRSLPGSSLSTTSIAKRAEKGHWEGGKGGRGGLGGLGAQKSELDVIQMEERR